MMTSNVSNLVKVKLLEWQGATSDCFMCAETMLGDYHVMVEYDDEWTCDFEPRGGRPVNIIRWRNSPDAAKSAAQADYESRILAALTPAEQCFTVNEDAQGAALVDWTLRSYPAALTIRSAEEVRREALEEAEQWLWEYMGTKMHGLYVKGSMTKALIDTPAPSSDTTPSRTQCCMCGKKGISTIEDGGPECQLDDDRWVCSRECYGKAIDMTPSVAEAAKVICYAWDADTIPVSDPHPMLPSFIEALRALAAQTGEPQ